MADVEEALSLSLARQQSHQSSEKIPTDHLLRLISVCIF